MMDIIKEIVESVSKLKEYNFFAKSNGRPYIMDNEGSIWTTDKNFKKKKKKKYVFNVDRWVTKNGRSTTKFKDDLSKLKRQLKKMGGMTKKKKSTRIKSIKKPKVLKPIKRVKFKKLHENPSAYIKRLTEIQLVKILKKCSDLYYNKGTSPLTDAEYDMVEDALKKINPKNKQLKKIGAPIKKRKVKLPFYMPSLDKKKTEAALDKWTAKYVGPYIVTDKLDGISLGEDSKNGLHMYTRGDGTYGQDISHLAKYFKFHPKKVKKGVQARGEAIIPEATFKKFFKDGKTARNTAGGLLNRDDVDVKVMKRIRLVMYKLINPNLKPSAGLKKLKAMGFRVVAHKKFKVLTFGTLETYMEQRKKKSKFKIDGLVIEQDVVSKVKKTNPKNAIAFKTNTGADTAVATVKEVVWNVSKHGYLKPKAKLIPIKLSGVTIKYVTLHNAYYVLHGHSQKDKKSPERPIGKGTKLRIVRSGDVIPFVMEIVKGKKKADMPKEPYEWTDTGVDIYIVGDESEAMKLKKITNFFRVIGVRDFSTGLVSKLLDYGFTSIQEICELDKEDLLGVPGIKIKTASKIESEIVKALKNVEPHKFMFASGAFGRIMGSKRIKLVLEKFPDIIKQYKKKKPNQWVKEIASISGFKDTTASAFVEGIPRYILFLKTMPKKRLKITKIKKVKKKGIRLEQHYVLFTGVRDKELETAIKEQGGQVGNSKSKMTILVAKDPDSTSGKAKKAREKGIPIMTIQQFKKRFKM